jgi:hypothetical protein
LQKVQIISILKLTIVVEEASFKLDVFLDHLFHCLICFTWLMRCLKQRLFFNGSLLFVFRHWSFFIICYFFFPLKLLFKKNKGWHMFIIITTLKFQWQWFIKTNLGRITLSSISCHCKLSSSKLKFIYLIPKWRGMERCFFGFAYLLSFFFQHHIHKKILNTFFTNLHLICFNSIQLIFNPIVIELN